MPMPKKRYPNRRMAIYCPETTLAELRRYADAFDRSANSVMCEALAEFFRNRRGGAA